MKMSCHEHEERLIDHALGDAADATLEAHLRDCTDCRARLDEERRLRATLDGILTSTLGVAPTPGFELAVRRRVAGTRRSWRARPMPWIAAGLAAVALILALWPRSTAPIAPPAAPIVTESTPIDATPPVEPTAAEPTAAPKPPAAVLGGRAAAPLRSSPEVLVPPDSEGALSRYVAHVRGRTGDILPAAEEPPLASAPVALGVGDVGTLDELPRLSTSEVPPAEPLPPLPRLAIGGES